MKVIIILLIAIFFLYKKIKDSKENESKNTCESDVFDSSYFDDIQDEPGEIIDSLAEKEGVEMISEEEIMGLGEEEKRKFSLRDAIIYSTILDRPYK